MDDCANNWGTVLFEAGGKRTRTSLSGFEKKAWKGLGETQFNTMVNHHLGGAFHVSKVTANGSDANMHA